MCGKVRMCKCLRDSKREKVRGRETAEIVWVCGIGSACVCKCECVCERGRENEREREEVIATSKALD